MVNWKFCSVPKQSFYLSHCPSFPKDKALYLQWYDEQRFSVIGMWPVKTAPFLSQRLVRCLHLKNHDYGWPGQRQLKHNLFVMKNSLRFVLTTTHASPQWYFSQNRQWGFACTFCSLFPVYQFLSLFHLPFRRVLCYLSSIPKSSQFSALLIKSRQFV